MFLVMSLGLGFFSAFGHLGLRFYNAAAGADSHFETRVSESQQVWDFTIADIVPDFPGAVKNPFDCTLILNWKNMKNISNTFLFYLLLELYYQEVL